MFKGETMKNIIESDITQWLEPYGLIFDNVRIIDPVNKKVIYSIENEDIKGCVNHHDSILEDCKECICIKALIDQKTVTKIRRNGNRMLLIFAIPVMINSNALVIELVKEITDDIVYETVIEDHEQQNIRQDLNTLILKDSMTNLYNRRFADQNLPSQIKKCDNSHPLSVALVDVDYFKLINDTYGHGAGDKVIKKVSKIMSSYIREDIDWVARFGGDEFLFCFPGIDQKRAINILERIRKTVEKTKITLNHEKVQVTISFGLYTTIDKDITMINLIRFADEKLYQAKELGRNRIDY